VGELLRQVNMYKSFTNSQGRKPDIFVVVCSDTTWGDRLVEQGVGVVYSDGSEVMLDRDIVWAAAQA